MVAFSLRVGGDSIFNDAIMEGDFSLMHPQPTAVNGGPFVAMVNGEAT